MTEKDEAISEIDLMISDHEKSFVKKILLPSPYPDRTIGQNGLIFIHRLLRRSHAFLEGGMDAIKGKNLLCLVVIARAHFETTGALAVFLDALDRHYKGLVTYENLDKTLESLSLAAPSLEIPEGPKKIHVNDGIRAVDELVARWTPQNKEAHKMFWDAYATLSDFVHPNQFGTTHHSIVNEDAKENIFVDSTVAFEAGVDVLLALNLSGGLFLNIFGKIKCILEEKEQIPKVET